MLVKTLNMDLEFLEHCSALVLEKFLHAVIDDICNRKSINEVDYIPNVWQTQRDFLNAVHLTKSSLKRSIGRDKKERIVVKISDEKQKVVIECLEVRKAELRTGVINEILAHSKQRVLQDFDWEVNAVLSSNKLININECLVTLNFKLLSNGVEESVSLELNNEELEKVIVALEDAKEKL